MSRLWLIHDSDIFKSLQPVHMPFWSDIDVLSQALAIYPEASGKDAQGFNVPAVWSHPHQYQITWTDNRGVPTKHHGSFLKPNNVIFLA